MVTSLGAVVAIVYSDRAGANDRAFVTSPRSSSSVIFWLCSCPFPCIGRPPTPSRPAIFRTHLRRVVAAPAVRFSGHWGLSTVLATNRSRVSRNPANSSAAEVEGLILLAFADL